MSMRLSLITAAWLLVLAISGRASYAIVIAVDSFDYATGNLATQNGGTGFSTAWTAGTAQVQTPGLTYPSLTSAGNKVFVSGSNQTWRQLPSVQGTGESTLWISFIGQRAGTDFVRFFGLSFYQGDVATSANEHLTIGENSNNTGDTWVHTSRVRPVDVLKLPTRRSQHSRCSLPRSISTTPRTTTFPCGSILISRSERPGSAPQAPAAWGCSTLRLIAFRSARGQLVEASRRPKRSTMRCAWVRPSPM